MKRETKAVLGLGVAVVLVVGALAGCGSGAATPAANSAEAYASTDLGTAYQGALPASTQLVLGTLKLEGTADAVTVDQAKAMLPLWQAIMGGGLKSQEEIDAVLKQIEGTMTADQLAAIAAMKLTDQDMAIWMQQQGMNFQPPDGTPGPEGTYGPRWSGTPGAGNGPRWSGTPGAGFGPGFAETPGPQQTERAIRRETMQAGGGFASGAGFAGRQGESMGQAGFLLRPLLQVLSERAGLSTPVPALAP